MSRAPLLQVEGLSKRFRGVQALLDVGFQVNAGELIGIIGPNGSGKTTLVNLLTGFIKADRGDVIYRGNRITGWKPQKIIKLGIARTFQMVKPFYKLSAFKNVIVPLYSPRVKKELGGRFGDLDEIALDYLEEVGFERDSSVSFKTAAALPQGYLKRLELAKTLALRPDLIILDELFSGLSLAEVAGIIPIIEKLCYEGKTIIMIEHRLKELFRIADRVIVLNYGRNIATGTAKEVMETEEVKNAYLGTESGSRDHGDEESLPRDRGVAKDTMLEVKNLMVFFENSLAINDLSLEIGRSQLVGVIGSNSAGKTTLMNTLSGLIIEMKSREKKKGGQRITLYGKIIFEGEDVSQVRPSDRVKKGIVLSRERHPIFPESSTLENLKTAGYLRKRSETDKKIEQVFQLFPALKMLTSRKAGFLSGGEQQMLAIGMALVVDPKLLLLDEPLLGLSPMLQKMLVDAVYILKKNTGMTILISEQFARPVLPILDHGYIIENGMLALSGTGPALMDNPEVKVAYFGV